MIFIVVKFTIRPDRSDEWLTLVNDFTEATRAEPGNVFFEWSRSVDTRVCQSKCVSRGPDRLAGR